VYGLTAREIAEREGNPARYGEDASGLGAARLSDHLEVNYGRDT
jgi:hypothetical protein